MAKESEDKPRSSAEAQASISEAQLCEDLHDLASQWRQLGVQLEVPQATLNKIQGGKNICPECLECIIEEWLNSDGEHTKTRLVEVLGMKSLGELTLLTVSQSQMTKIFQKILMTSRNRRVFSVRN
ncbi:hypothetical protein GBAR_LOCUS11802 [Geodia barretti]|uniref:Death domain-containing protein n=1 Tax=Geodia barretti TaxID=519541 RepID=A0AA35S062_GEOBA|nr:hypothetical protein GBAR_LOCUS11802 [Geodia barretti]